MKKFLLVLIITLISGVSEIVAQSTLVATLTHEDVITMFYGSDAFKSAHDSAASGDIITLSNGQFSGFDITKAVTIRGAGMNSTYIKSAMYIKIPESDSYKFSMEGVGFLRELYFYTSCSDPYFLKCKFKYGVYFEGSSLKGILFVNCISTSAINFKSSDSSTAVFSHCYLNEYTSNGNGSIQFINSIVKGALCNFHNSSFVNCVLCGTSQDRYGNQIFARLPEETIAMNCTAFSYNSNQYYNSFIYSIMQGGRIDCSTSSYEDVFKNFRGTYSDTETFELTDEAKAKYLGTDDTEIGLYGGTYPYNPTPAYPRITKMNVAKQTTGDDKLSVEIEVSASE